MDMQKLTVLLSTRKVVLGFGREVRKISSLASCSDLLLTGPSVTSLSRYRRRCTTTIALRCCGARRQQLLCFSACTTAAPSTNRLQNDASIPHNSNNIKNGALHSLRATTVQWLQDNKRSGCCWTPKETAMARYLLERWISMVRDSNNNDDTHDTTILMTTTTAARFATLILKQWLCQRSHNETQRTDTKELMEMFYRVMHLWQQVSSTIVSTVSSTTTATTTNSSTSTIMQIPYNALQLLQAFHNTSTWTNEPRLQPGPQAYSMVLETFINAASWSTTDIPLLIVEADTLILQLIERLSELASTSLSPLLPKDDLVVAYNSYFHLLAKYGYTPEKVESFVRQHMIMMMTTVSSSQQQKPVANERTYAAVLQAWANRGQPDRAMAFLNEILTLGVVNTVCFNICLDSLACTGRPQQAEELLWTMLHRYKQEGGNTQCFRPDSYSYLAVMNGWAKCNRVEHAMTVFERLLSLGDVQPTGAMYTAIMDAWSRRPNSGAQVEALLHRMEQLYHDSSSGAAPRPCRKAYTIAIRAWGNNTTTSCDGPDRATALLRQMQLISTASPDRHQDLTPCAITYTSLMRVWATSARNDGPQRALTILRHLEQLYCESGYSKHLFPDTIALNTVLHAFARHGRVREARTLLDEYKPRVYLGRRDGSGFSSDIALRPDAISWATVIHAITRFSNSSESSSSETISLLQELETVHETTLDPTLMPTDAIYVAVILAHVRDAEVAEAILWKMDQCYRQSLVDGDGNGSSIPRVPPSTSICNAVLYVWSQNDNPVAPQRAESILRWMKDQTNKLPNVAPDKVSFQYVVRAWEHSNRRHKGNYIERIESDIASQYPHLQLIEH